MEFHRIVKIEMERQYAFRKFFYRGKNRGKSIKKLSNGFFYETASFKINNLGLDFGDFTNRWTAS